MRIVQQVILDQHAISVQLDIIWVQEVAYPAQELALIAKPAVMVQFVQHALLDSQEMHVNLAQLDIVDQDAQHV